ncbi:unnamed protein product [Amoebophrya sp. A25]|nr:unnamed protein product [Amoebophrya sp. A25]|eukprot:GSA25T00005180001.1
MEYADESAAAALPGSQRDEQLQIDLGAEKGELQLPRSAVSASTSSAPSAKGKQGEASASSASASAETSAEPKVENRRIKKKRSFGDGDDSVFCEAVIEEPSFFTVRNVRHTARVVLKASGLGFAFAKIGCDCSDCW